MTSQPQAPTLAAISEIARVSKSTVSRALNNDPRISRKTRAQIARIAEDLGFAPNAIARGLSTRRSGIISFVITEMQHTVYQGYLEAITAIISSRGFQPMLFLVPNGADFRSVIPTMLKYRPDGCIVLAAVEVPEEAAAACVRYRIPLVLLNRTAPKTLAFTVRLNNWDGAHEVAEFLAAGEHRKIALISGNPDHPAAQERDAGFIEGLREWSLEVFAQRQGHFTHDGGYAAARDLLESSEPPDAIFAAGDMMALGVIDALRDSGKHVPENISVIGFDGIRAGALPAYAVTTFLQPVDLLFKRAMDLIVEHSSGGHPTAETILIQGKLIVRKSSRLPSARHHAFAVKRGWL
jgi:DNA-binding LacI/PurR family transcriptional regulator